MPGTMDLFTSMVYYQHQGTPHRGSSSLVVPHGPVLAPRYIYPLRPQRLEKWDHSVSTTIGASAAVVSDAA